MIAFFIRQHRSVNFIFFFVILVGGYYFVTGQKEAFPAIGFDVVRIQTSYPGASAEEVDKLVTKKIVDVLKNVEGKESITSDSSEGFSSVFFSIDSDAGLTLAEVKEKIRNEVDKITDLPDDAKAPVIAEQGFRNNQSIINVLFAGGESYEQLRDYVDRFEDDVRNVSGVGKVSKGSYRKSQVWVEILPEELERYEIEISEVVQRIRARNLNVSAGKLEMQNKEFFIKVSQAFTSLKEIENIILRANDDGQAVYVKDVAKVKWELEEASVFMRIDGKEAISVRVFQLDKGDIINIANGVRELIKTYKTSILPDTVEVFDYDDISFYVKRRLGILSNNATFGLFLVFLCLILFFEFRITFWTTMGIPFSFCLAIIITYSLGITLNLMSMFGFIIVIGMIVDDAIIVSENVYRRNEAGEDLFIATVKGTKEMIIPITAIVSTTIVSFLPLVTLPGIFGKVLGIIPKVVIVTMIASFIECIFFLPGHIANMKLKKKAALENSNSQSPPPANTVKTRRWFLFLQEGYSKALALLLRQRVLNLVLAIVFSIATGYFIFKKIPFVFFPGEVERATITMELPITASKEQTREVVDQVERELKTRISEYIRESITYVGQAWKGSSSRTRSYLATIYITLEPELPIEGEQVIKEVEKIMTELSEEQNLVKYDVEQLKGGPPAGKPVDVNLTGTDMNQMLAAANELAEELETFSNLTSITIGSADGKEEVVVSPDEQTANLLGINYDSIGAAIRNAFGAFSTTTANSMQVLNEEVDVVVKYEKKKEQNVAVLSNTLVKNKQGFSIPLKNFATLNYVKTSDVVERDDGKLYINVFAQLVNPRNKAQNATVVNKAIEAKEKELLKKYPKLTGFSYRGEKESQDELQAAALRAVLLGLFGVFFVLTSLFGSYVQPLIVMLIIPFSVLGVLVGLFINSTP